MDNPAAVLTRKKISACQLEVTAAVTKRTGCKSISQRYHVHFMHQMSPSVPISGVCDMSKYSSVSFFFSHSPEHLADVSTSRPAGHEWSGRETATPEQRADINRPRAHDITAE